jgi:hypothetical protein
VTAPPQLPLPPCHQYRDFDEAEHAALLDWSLANREGFELEALRDAALRIDDMAAGSPAQAAPIAASRIIASP